MGLDGGQLVLGLADQLGEDPPALDLFFFDRLLQTVVALDRRQRLEVEIAAAPRAAMNQPPDLPSSLDLEQQGQPPSFKETVSSEKCSPSSTSVCCNSL